MGLNFERELPLNHASNFYRMIPPAPRQELSSVTRKMLPRILVVDDEESVRANVAFFLAEAYLVEGCDNAEEAITKVHQTPYDGIILDVRMAPTDGITCLRQLRQIDRDVGITILTGESDIAVASDATDAGIDGFLQKPYTSTEIIRKVADLVKITNRRRHFASVQSAHESFLTEAARNFRADVGTNASAATESVHDLLTPLTSTAIHLDLAGNRLNGATRENIEVIAPYIEKSLADARRCTEHCLSVAGAFMRETQTNVTFSPVDLGAVAQETASLLFPLDSYRISVSQEATVISAYRPGIVRILSNLISNSIDNSASEIRVIVSATNDIATLIVRDNGTGMAEAAAASLFSIDANEQRGLGHAIIARLVALHRGSIHARAALNSGMQVTIQFPLLKK